MRGTRAALRYAKATLAFAEEAQASKAVAKDMQGVHSLVSENNELQTALENPLLASADKQSILNALFPNASPQTLQLFSLLATNNRLSLIGATAKQFLTLYADQKGEVSAVVTTAVPLTPSLQKVVLEKAKSLTQKQIQLENKVNPDILGGFVLKIGDLQYDASVVHQLKAIKTTLTKTNSI
jgi:F-type H+-transporting ATPase subunit delta